MADCLCDRCAGLCCRYFALPIDNPASRRDFDNIRWYLLHENVTVFIEKRQWYLGIANRCKALQDDNRCGIYHTRPKVCRGYSTDNCDWHGGEYDFETLFTSAEQLEQYAKKRLEADRGKKRRKVKKGGRGGKAKARSQSRRPRRDLKQLSEALTRRVRQTSNDNGHGVALTVRGR
jgi:Fe-S-cluster containining protein